MDLSNILTINGKPGLFKLISKTKNSFIVESLIDKKKSPAFSHDGISSLDNIAIFTEDDDVALEKILLTIYDKEKGNKIPDIMNDNNKMKSYFEEILPDYDKERVYVSNIKKVLLWYNLLLENDLISPEENQETETAEKTEDTVVPEETRA